MLWLSALDCRTDCHWHWGERDIRGTQVLGGDFGKALSPSSKTRLECHCQGVALVTPPRPTSESCTTPSLVPPASRGLLLGQRP